MAILSAMPFAPTNFCPTSALANTSTGTPTMANVFFALPGRSGLIADVRGTRLANAELPTHAPRRRRVWRRVMVLARAPNDGRTVVGGGGRS